MSNPTIQSVLKDLVAEHGWKPGTHLENQVALLLTRSRLSAEQQHQVGRYRLDFAWPDVKIALEADGWWHRSPEGATSDRQRDSWLRSQGWVVFRVDDEHGEDSLREQVVRVAHLVRSQAPAGAPWCLSIRSYPDPYIRWPLTKHLPR